jgi:hypothetical protein
MQIPCRALRALRDDKWYARTRTEFVALTGCFKIPAYAGIRSSGVSARGWSLCLVTQIQCRALRALRDDKTKNVSRAT